jgi:DNA-binding GntR family transcriptional regulator
VATRRKLILPPALAPTLKHNVAEVLSQAILEGRIGPGERLNESQLSRELKVSRAPIREALHQLEESGLVVNHPRRGMFVVNLTDAEISQINGIRILLEAEALRQAAANLTSVGAAELDGVLHKLERSSRTQSYALIRLDHQFHRTIWKLTRNEFLERTLNGLVAPVFAHSSLRLAKTDLVELDSHQPLADFVKGKSMVSAEDVMRRHLKAYWSFDGVPAAAWVAQ